MKKLLYSISFIAISSIFTLQIANAQNATEASVDTTVDLDMLTVPNSPAFTLLGISPSDIDKPTTPADFAFSIANATNNISQLPKNYAIEFLPLNVFSKKEKHYDSLKTNSIWSNFKQSLTLSSGFSTNDSVDASVSGYIKTRSGVGFRFSLFRGEIDTASTFSKNIDTLKRVDSLLVEIHKGNFAIKKSIEEEDPIYNLLDFDRKAIAKDLIEIDKKLKSSLDPAIIIGLREDSINTKNKLDLNASLIAKRIEIVKVEKLKEQTEEQKKLASQLKKTVESVKYYRFGWLLDFAGGMVLGFRNDDFQNSIVQQYSFWFNGGYSCKHGFNILGVARYNNFIKVSIDENGNKKDNSSYDFGGKLEYVSNDKKFSINGEIVGRFLSTATSIGSDTITIKSLSRYSLNACYQVGKNQALTFTIGKAFSGKAQYGGNLIAALNYIKTFGTKQNLASQKK